MRAEFSFVLVAAPLATGIIAPFGTGPARAATAGFRGVCNGGTNQQRSRGAA
ncbi:hypothetical protein [Actinoplanes lobatus]|uniref:Uncharacterized protein n=1 Tax=Actinoplanes lobatus TaxID=113568 RepID=A0A7W7MJZ7_9ACTN|nr:hypothetical protein [Actinoplanes lobatus]MBB4753197.1 hypothetical protein [Actinoplanes lobatus]